MQVIYYDVFLATMQAYQCSMLPGPGQLESSRIRKYLFIGLINFFLLIFDSRPLELQLIDFKVKGVLVEISLSYLDNVK